MASKHTKPSRHQSKPNENVHCSKFPVALLPVNPAPEEVTAQFESSLGLDLAKVPTAFIDQVVSHTIHGLPSAMVKQVLAHKVDDKYMMVGPGGAFKKKSFEGPKRSKLRKTMSSRQRKANGFDVLGPGHENYELYLPLHELWRQYMADLLVGSKADKASRLARADWHGSLVQVIKSCSPGIVGTTGIILQETTNTFKVITAENKYKTIPKANTVFSMQVNDSTVATLYGNHILYKSADRSVRKFKAKQTIDIGV